MKKWTRFLYNPCIGLKADKSRVTASKEHIESSKYAASQGMVLLKNEEKTLPLKGYKKVVLIGKGSFDYVKGGGGSGEVNCDYVRNIYDGLKAKENIDIFEPVCTHYRNYVEECYRNGEFPGLLSEIDLPDHLLKRASAFSDTAIYTISRFSGENWDRSEVEAPMELNIPVLPDDPNREKGYWDMNLLAVAKEKFPDRDFYLTGSIPDLKTLPLGVLFFQGSFTTDWGAMGATMVISSLPAIIVYALFSEQVEKAMTIGGSVKG